MRLRHKPNQFDQQHQALMAKAFAVHSGKTPADIGNDKPDTQPRQEDPRVAQSEQREDELLETIDHALQGAQEAVAELKGVQEEEEAPQHEADGDTGSPSAQGWP